MDPPKTPPNGFQKYLEALKWVGFPIAMCGVFVAWQTGWMPSLAMENNRLIMENNKLITETLKAFREEAAQTRAAFSGLRLESRHQVNLAMCLAFARSPDVQRQCVERSPAPVAP